MQIPGKEKFSTTQEWDRKEIKALILLKTKHLQNQILME